MPVVCVQTRLQNTHFLQQNHADFATFDRIQVEQRSDITQSVAVYASVQLRAAAVVVVVPAVAAPCPV